MPSLRIALLSFFLVGCPTEPDVETVTVTCDDPLDGLDWGDGAPADAEPGVEDELAALDLSSLPDEVDVSGLSPLFRGYLAYALETPPDELGDSVNRDEALAHGELGEVALGSLLLGQEDPTGIDFFFFRRGFQRYSVCSTGLPVTLDGFKATFGDHEAIDGEVVDSDAKCTDRRLRANHGDQVFVAETLVDGVCARDRGLAGRDPDRRGVRIRRVRRGWRPDGPIPLSNDRRRGPRGRGGPLRLHDVPPEYDVHGDLEVRRPHPHRNGALRRLG